ncbi:MAG: prepilin-type N-terminal cleavage/methylation domain-containing protein [Pseudomonadota bacterium]
MSLIIPRSRRATNAGFSLVELMVAMVLGLIVIGSVIALVLSMIRANNQTIAATRLTQELRAVAALMSSDLRRAGGVIDPLTVATAAGGNPSNPFAAIDTTTAGCIRYSYADAEGGNFHSINFRDGAVFLDAGNTARTCTGGTRLSSQQVTITGLTFQRQSPCGTANAAGRCIRLTLTGRLTGDATITRQFTQDIYVRSLSGA